jgi:hypothetical protein
MVRFTLIASVLLAVTAASAMAGNGSVWATVNVCDTADHPDEIGIRAAMPARRRTTELLRFRVQYRDLSDGRWRPVRGADSGWVPRRGRGTGWSFEVAGEGTQILRGVVLYRWVRHGHIVRRARRVTEGGHPSTTGADPEDFSAATCRIE